MMSCLSDGIAEQLLTFRLILGLYVWNDIGMGEFSKRLTYSNWDVKEPNDRHYFNQKLNRCTGEDCVQIKKSKSTASWFDANCKTSMPFVCEKNRGK